MRAVIYERYEIENGSLLLKVFTQAGKTKKLKIPGILKSKTRNSYFLAPATLWEFTITGNEREVATPKEYNLEHSPFNFNTGYRELATIGEILKPLAFLKPDLEVIPLFNDLSNTLYEWKCGDETTEKILLNKFYLKFLLHMGLLHFSPHCVHCGNTLAQSDRYHLFSGSICGLCLRGQTFREEELIPNSWLNNYLGTVPGNDRFEKMQEFEFRKKILNFFKVSI